MLGVSSHTLLEWTHFRHSEDTLCLSCKVPPDLRLSGLGTLSAGLRLTNASPAGRPEESSTIHASRAQTQLQTTATETRPPTAVILEYL